MSIMYPGLHGEQQGRLLPAASWPGLTPASVWTTPHSPGFHGLSKLVFQATAESTPSPSSPGASRPSFGGWSQQDASAPPKFLASDGYADSVAKADIIDYATHHLDGRCTRIPVFAVHHLNNRLSSRDDDATAQRPEAWTPLSDGIKPHRRADHKDPPPSIIESVSSCNIPLSAWSTNFKLTWACWTPRGEAASSQHCLPRDVQQRRGMRSATWM